MLENAQKEIEIKFSKRSLQKNVNVQHAPSLPCIMPALLPQACMVSLALPLLPAQLLLLPCKAFSDTVNAALGSPAAVVPKQACRLCDGWQQIQCLLYASNLVWPVYFHVSLFPDPYQF